MARLYSERGTGVLDSRVIWCEEPLELLHLDELHEAANKAILDQIYGLDERVQTLDEAYSRTLI